MKILAVDTATQSCSAAILNDGSLLAEFTTAINQTHSRHLMEVIQTVCRVSKLKIGDLDGFAVTVGPGSFTGLRIGISTIKGLAWSMRKPLVGVSSLDVLAWQCAQSTYLICPLLDARKKEVYFCRYRFKNSKLKKEGIEQVMPPSEALREIREPCIFVGNGALLYREKILSVLGELANFTPPSHNIVRASSVAAFSMMRFNGRKTDDPVSLVPHYIRKSDAELKGRRHSGGTDFGTLTH